MNDADATRERCNTCGLELAQGSAAEMGVNPPPEAACYRNHAEHEGCLFATALKVCRGNWLARSLDGMTPSERSALAHEMAKIEKYL